MSTIIEGRNAVLEALRSGAPVRRLLVAEGTKPNSAIEEIYSLAQAADIPVQRVARKKLDAASERGAHQGVMIETVPFVYTPLAEVIERSGANKRSLVIVLDHVTDPGNLGAVIRSAEVAGADAVVIPKDRSAGVGPVAFKSSAGAVVHIPIVQTTNLVRALNVLKEEGYWVGGAAADADSMLWDAPMDGRIVLVMGAEGPGLSRLVRENCDFTVALPVAGQVDSLNVAQATSVLAFEWVRRGRTEG